MENIDIKKVKKAFTHGGIFHADDVFSTALLRILNPDIVIERGNVVPDNYDGLVFDIGRGRFDHHQADKRYRENGIAYAAFGLLWNEFGTLILTKEEADEFDAKFIQDIDLNDNTGKSNPISACIADFLPVWDDKETDITERFYEAADMAERILRQRFEHIAAKRRASTLVKKMLEKCDGKVLVMDEVMPWKDTLKKTDIYYVIFESDRGGYIIQAVPTELADNDEKLPFPESWRGLPADELKAHTGIETLTFCHTSGFLCVAGTLEDAEKTAYLSLKEQGM